MSARSVRRNHARLQEDARRRNARRAKRAGIAAGAALGATALFAPAAQAANYEVDTLADPGDPNGCVVGNPAPCSIRDAVDQANLDPDADAITFLDTLTGTIRLANGEMDISDGTLSISDTGPNQVTISGDTDPTDGNPNGDSRIFRVRSDVNLTLDGLRLTDGYHGGYGGAIFIGSDYGGGDEAGANVVIRNSEISGNATDGNGGGIAAFADKYSSLEIHESTISGNEAEDDGGGLFFQGGISPAYVPGTLLISNSTVSGNFADEGGGIDIRISAREEEPVPAVAGALADGSAVNILNSTIASNDAAEDGGGIYLTFNRRLSGGSGFIAAGALSTDPLAMVPLSSTIVADNRVVEPVFNDSQAAGATFANDLATGESQTEEPSFKLDHSLVETADDAIVTEDPAGSNIRNTDPVLGTLADNGGPTQTHLPALTSPALDVGVANGLTTDQRGTGFDRTVDRSPANGAGDGTDMGSVEIQADPDPIVPIVIPDEPGREPLRQLPDGCTLSLAGGDALRYAGDSSGESVNGTDGNDIIRGFNGNDTILGRPGDDCLTGDNGEDVVNGEDGDDFGRGGSDNDRMDGGPDDDDFGSGGGEDVMKLSSGDDRGVAGGGDDRATGGTGKDLIRGRAGDDTVIGGSGGDDIKGGRDNDEIKGGDGKDDLRGGFGSDVITGGPDADKIDCGKGDDVAIVDAEDTVSRDCETVK